MSPRRIKFKTAAGELEFRIPDEWEVADYLGGLPVLPGTPEVGAKAKKRPPMSEMEIKKAFENAENLLISCSLDPRIERVPDPSAQGVIGIREIPVHQRMVLAKNLLEKANYKVEAVEEIRPT